MGSKLLRLTSVALRMLATLTSLYIVGISGYHLQYAQKSRNSPPNPTPELYYILASSSAASLYGLVSVISLCFPRALFILLVVLDALFSAAFTATAVLLRPPFCRPSRWLTPADTPYRKPSVDCELDRVAFGVSIAAAVLWALLTLASCSLYCSWKRNRAFGPGPNNGYAVDGVAAEKRGRRRWGRNRGSVATEEQPVVDPYTGQPAGTYTGDTYSHSHGHRAHTAGTGAFDPELKRAYGKPATG